MKFVEKSHFAQSAAAARKLVELVLKAKGHDSPSAYGSLPVLYGDSLNVRDGSTYDCGGNRDEQASRFAGLDGSGVLCGGRRRCRDSWSRGKYLKQSPDW